MWSANGHWSSASAKVHRIPASHLHAHGHDPAPIAAALNQVLAAPAIAWCDGGPYDAHWINALFKAAGAKPAFTLGDWRSLAAMPGPDAHTRTLGWLARAPALHRARPDAEQLLHALGHGIGIPPGPTRDLADSLPALAPLSRPGS